jgi:hypothetical protein
VRGRRTRRHHRSVGCPLCTSRTRPNVPVPSVSPRENIDFDSCDCIEEKCVRQSTVVFDSAHV